MSGLGEASAIIGLVSLSAKLSEKLVDVSIKYKGSRAQIAAFGKDIDTFGHVLDQLRRLLDRRGLQMDAEVLRVIHGAVEQCESLFSEIDCFKEKLYSRSNPSSPLQLTFRSKARWVFKADELQILQARLDSTRMNILLLMTLECLHKCPSPESFQTHPDAQQVRTLALQSEDFVQRLQTVEEESEKPELRLNDSDERASTQRSSTASLARSTRDSIISLYNRDSFLQKILEPEADDEGLFKAIIDEQRFSHMIEDYIIDEPALDAPESSELTLIASSIDEGSLNGKEAISPRRKWTDDAMKSPSMFPSRAKALRSHQANNSQGQQLSIQRNEMLLVSATNSKYWMAMNSNGDVGLIRARYVVLQDDDSSSDDPGDPEPNVPFHQHYAPPKTALEPVASDRSPTGLNSVLKSPARPNFSARKKRPKPLQFSPEARNDIGPGENNDFSTTTSSSPLTWVGPANGSQSRSAQLPSEMLARGRQLEPDAFLPSIMRDEYKSQREVALPFYSETTEDRSNDGVRFTKSAPTTPALANTDKSLPELPRSAQSQQTHDQSSPNLSTPEGPSADYIAQQMKRLHIKLDDETSTVLPKFLKKYNIESDWREYTLYIVKDSERRRLFLNDKPLKIFNSMRDPPGRSLMFELSKNPPSYESPQL